MVKPSLSRPIIFAMNATTGNKYPDKSSVKAAIYGFGRIGRKVLGCWHGGSPKPFDIVAIDAGSMSAEHAAQLLKCDYVLGTFDAVVQYGEGWMPVDGKQLDRGFAPCGNNFGHLGGQIPGIKECGMEQVEQDRHRPGGNRAVVIGAPAQSDIMPCVCASLPPPLQSPPVFPPGWLFPPPQWISGNYLPKKKRCGVVFFSFAVFERNSFRRGQPRFTGETSSGHTFAFKLPLQGDLSGLNSPLFFLTDIYTHFFLAGVCRTGQ